MPKKKRKALNIRTKRLTPVQKKKKQKDNKKFKSKKKLKEQNKRLKEENDRLKSKPASPKQPILFDSIVPSFTDIFNWSNFIFMMTIFLVTVIQTPIKKLEIKMPCIYTIFLYFM